MGININPLDGLNSATKFSPDRFRAAVTVGLGIASSNRFEIELPTINKMVKVNGEKVEDYTTSEDRVMLCTAAQLPGKQISTTNRGIGIEQQAIATGHTMPEVNLTFYLTNTYSMKHYFQEWQECITSQDPDNAQYVGYYSNYADGKEVRIRQYSRNARRVYSVKLIDAYPTNVSVIEYNNQAQAAAAELTVSLAYRTYTPDRETWAVEFGEQVGKIKDKFF